MATNARPGADGDDIEQWAANEFPEIRGQLQPAATTTAGGLRTPHYAAGCKAQQLRFYVDLPDGEVHSSIPFVASDCIWAPFDWYKPDGLGTYLDAKVKDVYAAAEKWYTSSSMPGSSSKLKMTLRVKTNDGDGGGLMENALTDDDFTWRTLCMRTAVLFLKIDVSRAPQLSQAAASGPMAASAVAVVSTTTKQKKRKAAAVKIGGGGGGGDAEAEATKKERETAHYDRLMCENEQDATKVEELLDETYNLEFKMEKMRKRVARLDGDGSSVLSARLFWYVPHGCTNGRLFVSAGSSSLPACIVVLASL